MKTIKEYEAEVKKWKNATIIAVFFLVVVSSVFLASYVVGTKLLQADADCNSIVCGYADKELGMDITSYYYDITTHVCSCYSGNGEKVYDYLMD